MCGLECIDDFYCEAFAIHKVDDTCLLFEKQQSPKFSYSYSSNQHDCYEKTSDVMENGGEVTTI